MYFVWCVVLGAVLFTCVENRTVSRSDFSNDLDVKDSGKY